MFQDGAVDRFIDTVRQDLSGGFKKGRILHSLSIVMTGTAVAQLFGLAMMPVVSRLFTPADFGVYGTFFSIVGIWASVITLAYSQALVLPKLKDDALNLFMASLLSLFVILGLTAVAVVLFPGGVQHLLKVEDPWYLPLFLVAIFVMGLNLCLDGWCTRAKAFVDLAVSQVLRMVAAVGLWIVFGLYGLGALGLVIGVICGDFLAGLNLARYFRRDIRETLPSVTPDKIRFMASTYRDFPLYAMPSGLITALSHGLPVILLGYYYGVAIAGLYAFGIRILQTPTGFVAEPLWRVVFQRGSEIHNHNGDLFPFFYKSTGGILAVVLIPAVLMFAWAPQLFYWLFGADWWEAGIYARWLILWVSGILVIIPAGALARILRQQRNLFFLSCLILVARASVLVLGGLYLGVLNTVIAFSVVSFVIHMGFVLWIGTLLLVRRSRQTLETA